MRRFPRLPRLIRRRLGRPAPPWIGRRLLAPLRNAHRLREVRRYGEAAGAFAELSRLAWALAPAKAALLAVEAGLAYLLSDRVADGRPLLEEGLSWLRQNAPATRSASVTDRVAAELRNSGRSDDAAWVEALAPAGSAPPAPVRRLPPRCPSCGGGLVPGEVDWADEHSAICGYCGSVVPAGG